VPFEFNGKSFQWSLNVLCLNQKGKTVIEDGMNLVPFSVLQSFDTLHSEIEISL